MHIHNGITRTKLDSLHSGEEQLRTKAQAIVDGDTSLQLHLSAVEAAMDVADVLRQFPTSDEDLKVAILLGMRTFNAFGSSLKLIQSGYNQNGALIMRDILETVFLLDLFRGDRTLIKQWRPAEKKTRMKKFGPVMVRKALDDRDDITSMKRFEIYEMFSEMAAHPAMKSSWMMRPEKNGDATIGPFIEAKELEATISEMGRLAIQVGEILTTFFPANWEQGSSTCNAFTEVKSSWLSKFYSSLPEADTNE